ncbi:MAG: DNA polymerase III subunit delta [Desulfobulbaceae bacterium]|nr:DNA polymerase III subunit delta [Desulfobulbaceae bacterium]
MAILKRSELPTLLKALDRGQMAPVYLVVGERFLCQQAVEELLRHLLPDERQRAACLTQLDGEHEEPGQTLNQLRTYSLFGGRRVIKVSDSRLLFSKVVGQTLWERAVEYQEKNDPAGAARCLRQFLELEGLAGAELLELASADWQAQLGFARPAGDLAWVRDLVGGGPTGSKGATVDTAELYLTALREGLPGGNILILTAEAADKRKKLYKTIAEVGVIVDLAVDSGSSKAADKGRAEVVETIVRKTLADFGKTIDAKALAVLVERVGFHPVAAGLESEKLALFADERKSIGVADINEVVGRTREEAIFELNEAVGNRDLAAALAIAGRLQEGGTHALAIIGALHNYLRKLLVVKALQGMAEPTYSPGLAFAPFQAYLERLKKSRAAALPKEISGHPYAIYMLFGKAEKFSLAELTGALTALLEADYDLKGSGLPAKLLLDALLLRLLRSPNPAAR